MDKVNAGIFTFFMDNIDRTTVDLHAKVIQKFNKSGHPHHHISTQLNHGASMDLVWTMNGQSVQTFKGHNVAKKFDFDVVMFLDIDAVPCDNLSLDYYINQASRGVLIGNVQRSNHIQNDQHIFAAPSVVAMSVETFATIGFPSAIPTRRGDVGEEYTYAAEKAGIVPIQLLMPLSFEEAPAECPAWKLKDGMPVYGRGTTFGIPKGPHSSFGAGEFLNEIPMFWHQFQSFHPGQQEKYRSKLEQILTEPTITSII